MVSIDPIKPKSELKSREIKIHKGRLVVQRKYNGCRATSTTDEDGTNHLWSRNISKVTGKRIEYSGKLPHIVEEMDNWNVGGRKKLGLPPGTVLDGELVSLRGQNYETGIENFKDVKCGTSGYDESGLEYQESTGHYLSWIIFDVVHYAGKPLHGLSLEKRLEILQMLFSCNDFEWIHLAKAKPFRGKVQDYKDRALRLGWEGYVVKNLDSTYRYSKTAGNTKRPPGTWWKIKPEKFADVIITGFEYGTPGTKNEDRVGKFICHQYHPDGTLMQVCKVGTGFTDEERERYLSLKFPLVGLVQYAERNDNAHLIHPSWKGFREDKNPEECIIEELQ